MSEPILNGELTNLDTKNPEIMEKKFKLIGIGEVLWDMLPGGKQLGGAPANFAYMASVLGNEGIVASRVGLDNLGQEALKTMGDLGLSTEFMQKDPSHATGTAVVEVDAAGQPKFTITPNVAWDFLEWAPVWLGLAQLVDAVCFGSLGQRNTVSRETIRKFLRAIPDNALRIFDVNLRQNFFSADLIRDSLSSAQLVKLNHEELPVVAEMLGISFTDEQLAARQLLEAFELKLVCVTRGANGSLLVTPSATSSHKGFSIEVVDTVGAGDAFTACLVHHFLRGTQLDRMNQAANRFAAWVAGQQGATPLRDETLMKEVTTA